MITSCASTNRETVVEIVNPARKTKKIKLQLNYNISVFSRYLKVLTLKQSPDEPDYDIHQVIYQPKNSEAVQWTDENFPGFREELLASKKINLQVHVTDAQRLTPAQQRRAMGAASSHEKGGDKAASLLSPGVRKYMSPARKSAIPDSRTLGSPATAPRSAVRTPSASRTPSSPGGSRRVLMQSTTPATPGTRSALKLNRPTSRQSPTDSKAKKVPKTPEVPAPVEEAPAEEDVPETVSVPTIEIGSEFSFCAAEKDLLSDLCGQAENQDIKETGIKETWTTRNSNGSITSSSSNETAVRDHSLSSVESAESHVSVSRNLKDEMASVQGDKEEEDVGDEEVPAEQSYADDNLECFPMKTPHSVVSATASASKRSSVLRATMTVDKKPTQSSIADSGNALIDGKTTAQVEKSWASTLRTGGGGNFPAKNTPKKTPGKSGEGDGRRGTGFGCSNVSPKMNRAMRLETRATTDAEGRPSMATMTAQWEFMREQFLSSSDEQLEWLMESRRGGAYKYAHRKNEKAEDQYFKSIVDIEILETKLKLLKSENGPLSSALQQLASSYDVLFVNPNDDTEQQKVYSNQVSLRQLLDTELRSIFSTDLEKELKMLTENSDFPTVARKARKVHTVSLPEEIKKVQVKLAFANKINTESLKEMEKWGKREKETAEYDQVMAAEDREWMVENQEANFAALRKMRSLIPVDIAAITVLDLMERSRSGGHIMPLELANEIKSNKLLQWIVTAPEDIAFDNFLNGEKRQYFANIEGLDVTEMRAIRMCLPPRFELDNDGNKTEWRERFIMRLKQLAGQENGDMVRGPWDFEAGKRSMVKLPPLKDEQARRAVYFFRMYDQSMAKLKQYDDRAAILQKKQGWLQSAETSATEFKSEYDTILIESRDNDFKKTYGADVVAKAKEMAKRAFQEADLKVKSLRRDVQTLRNTIANATVTREQFMESMEATKAYLLTRDITWETELKPVNVVGTFPEEPEIVRAVSQESAKFLSPEEEASERKAEIETLSQKKNDEACGADSEEVEPTTEVVPAANQLFVTEPVTKNTDVAVNPPSSVMLAVGAFDSRRKSMFDGPVPTSAPVLRRRNSVLESANADMISKLNSMLSGNGPAPPAGVKQVQRSSLMPPPKTVIFAGDSENIDSNLPPPAPKVVTTSSKTLMKLLNAGDAAEKEGNMQQPPAKFSFLDQIKAKKNGSSVTTDDDFPSASTAQPVSFLDAIKSRRVE